MDLHPNIHSKLINFSENFSYNGLILNNETAILFFEEVGIIPSRTSTAPVCCVLPMKVENKKDAKLGWIWRCSTVSRKIKGCKDCRKVINPSTGTFMDGDVCHISARELLAIIISFVIKKNVSQVYEDLRKWRENEDGCKLSWSTVIDYYSYCREIAEVVASYDHHQYGGANKTVQIDETFLTKRKYHRGRVNRQMTIIVLGIYCKEDKEGRFFRVRSKSRADLWPYIKKYIHPDVEFVCTDSARQYFGVEKLFNSNTKHLQTNHNGEYVSKTDPRNTINDLENQNKLLKRNILCRKTDKLLEQYMALYFYRTHYLERQYKNCRGSQIFQFCCDIKRVYPGYVDGQLGVGMDLCFIDEPTIESMEIDSCLLSKIPRIATLEEELEDIEDKEDEIDEFFK